METPTSIMGISFCFTRVNKVLVIKVLENVGREGAFVNILRLDSIHISSMKRKSFAGCGVCEKARATYPQLWGISSHPGAEWQCWPTPHSCSLTLSHTQKHTG